MKVETKQFFRQYTLTALLASASLTLWNCSGEKKETSTEAESASTADSSFMGRQGDTLNSSGMDAPQQAPPDSASARGATVPAEVKVRAKQ